MSGVVITVLVVVFFAFVFICMGIVDSTRRANNSRSRSDLNQHSRHENAVRAAHGQKPFGQPWGNEFGNAYFQTPEQVMAKGFGYDTGDPEKIQALDRDGGFDFLTLGQLSYGGREAMVIEKGAGHLLTIAPTRSGKGISAIIPNLLTYKGSMLVLDIKGENQMVSNFRRAWMSRGGENQGTYSFNPWRADAPDKLKGEYLPANRWNPFDSIRDDPDDAWDDARSMAQLLLVYEGDNDTFWVNTARSLLSGLIQFLHFEKPKESQTLAEVYRLIAQDTEGFDETLAEMAASKYESVRNSANLFLRADQKVRDSIVTSLQSQMDIWGSGKLKDAMSTSDFDFKFLKDFPSTIFLTIPPDKVKESAALIRLFVGVAINTLTRYAKNPEFPVVFMLDEFPALGRVKAIEEGIPILAGYGIKLWMFAQDLKQLSAIYGQNTDSIVANCRVKQFFGVSDAETAKYVSALCGEMTVSTMNFSTTQGENSASSGNNVSSTSRPLLSPDEIMSMDAEKQLIFIQGNKPILAFKMPYLEYEGFYSDSIMGSMARPNPYHS